MARTSPVREDERGLYVRTNGAKYRPGKVAGYDHVLKMDAGGLVKGSRVEVNHVSQSPLAKIKSGETILHWMVED